MLKWVLAIAFAAAVPAVALAEGDAEAGKAVFNKCRACHMIGDGAKNMVGPNLTGVIGRKAGTGADFIYSDAMKATGWVWDEKVLDEYLKDPKAKVPGNKMLFIGIKDDTDRANVIAYLKTFSK